MNPITLFTIKSYRLPWPVAGMRCFIHRSCWPLVPLLCISACPLSVLANFPSWVASLLVCLTGLVAAVIFQIAAQATLARHFGAPPLGVILFAFGPVLTEEVAGLPVRQRLVMWLAGPSVNLVVGALLALTGGAVPLYWGREFLAYGLFSLLPVYPLAGSLVWRDALLLAGHRDLAVEGRLLEVSRQTVCLVAIGAPCSLSLPLLYSLGVLWMVCHQALLPGMDPVTILVSSRQWLRMKWAWMRRHLSSWLPCIFWAMILCNHSLTFAETTSAFSRKDGLPTLTPGLHEPWQNAGGSNWWLRWPHPFGLQLQMQSLMGSTELCRQQFRALETPAEPKPPIPAQSTKQRPIGILGLVLTGILLTGIVWLICFAEFKMPKWSLLSGRRQRREEPKPPAPEKVLTSPDHITAVAEDKAPGSGDTSGGSISSPIAWVPMLPVPHAPATIIPPLPDQRLRQESLLTRPVPEPATLLGRLIAASRRVRSLILKPSPPRPLAWNIGWASTKGPVRAKNEDYVLAFEMAGCQIVIVADGVSGEPFGAAAAYLASRSAAWSIIRAFDTPWPWTRPEPVVVAKLALGSASRRLIRMGEVFGCTAGLRTTLIVVVMTSNAYGYAYIGDGYGAILRATGVVEQFLTPQRAEGQAPNVIAACLGPTLLGSPVTGTSSRSAGDLLIAGTDGVFTESVQLGDDFPRDLLRMAMYFRGDLLRTVTHVLEELSKIKDGFGFLFEDNLSLALVADSQPPQLTPDCWERAARSDAQPVSRDPDHPVPETAADGQLVTVQERLREGGSL